MKFMPAGIGWLPIIVAALLCPLFVKKIEQNLGAFTFIMGTCAFVLSRSWHIGLVEDAIHEPIITGRLLDKEVVVW